MNMRIPWMPILGAAGALILVKIIGYYFGRNASLVALGVLLLMWWLAHSIYKKQLNRLEVHLQGLDEEQRKEVLAQASPELRKDIEKRAKLKRQAVGGQAADR